MSGYQDNERQVKMSRVWAMPTADTFKCPPIGHFVRRYLSDSEISIDPFARNCDWATFTNDLNPSTTAMYHLDAFDFLWTMRNQGIKPDLVIFDPPYSPRQIKECYNGIGLKMTQADEQRTHAWSKEKHIINQMLPLGGLFLYFGWDTVGMGKGRGFVIEEILLVCHGPGHNDTICIAERKQLQQLSLKPKCEGR